MADKKNSLRYNRLLRNIPTSSTLAEAGRKAGYAESTVKSDIYKHSIQTKIKQDLVEQGYSKEACQAEFKRIMDKTEELGDYSSTLRALEAISKIAGHYNDTNTSNIALFNLSNDDNKLLQDRLDKTQAVEVIDVAGNEASTIEDSTKGESTTPLKGKT